MLSTKNSALAIILSAPSGGGKSSIAKALVASDPKLISSISVTTRPPRSGEKNGVEYFFKSVEEFKKMIENNEFIEYTNIYGNYYGTLKKLVEDKLKDGYDVLFDINFAGCLKIKQFLTNNTVSIFLLPPSIEVLENRLISRGQDAPVIIKERLKSAISEMEQAKYYDYILINDNFNETIEKVIEIVNQERAKRNEW